MRGEFENIWNDAFEGAAITPSEEVWNGLAARLDRTSGKRNWVTILLIAATVTVAFAFPLTVGNSEYKYKPMLAGEVSDESYGVAVDVASGNSIQALPANASEPSHQGIEPLETMIPVNTGATERELTTNNGSVNDGFATLASVSSKSVFSWQPLTEEPGSLLEQYYILPVFRKDQDNFDKALLAYGNFNMGSQSASSGLNNFNLLEASADFANGPDLSNRAGDNRSEDGGTAFYVGVGAEIPLSQRFNLTAGVGYQNQRLNGSSNTIFEENGRQYPLGIYDPIKPGTVYLAENYDYVSSNHFISIPLGAKYVLVDKQVKLRIGLGVSPDVMLSHKVTAAEYGSNSTSLGETAYNTVQFTGLLNLDVLLPLQASYGLAIETGVRQGLVPYVQNGSRYTTTFNFGVILFYQLRK